METQELTAQYVALCNEPNSDRRRMAVERLWAADGVHVLAAPPAIAEAVETLGFPSITLEARGHPALQHRVGRAHHDFVATGQFTFRSRGDADRVGDVITFTWEMVTTEGEEVAAIGLEVLTLDPDGRIIADYQFIERSAR